MTRRLSVHRVRRDTLAKRLEYPRLFLKKAWRSVMAFGVPIDRKLVIFDAFNGRNYSCSPKAMYEALLKDDRFKDCTFVWVFQEPEKYGYLNSSRTRLVRYKSKEYYRAYAQAGTWMINAMISLDIPKRRSQVCVQFFHGTPFKRLRADIVKNTESAVDSYGDIVKKNHMDTARYDYFVTPSRFATDCFTSAFALKELGKEGIILETGYPRNDRLHSVPSEEVTKMKQKLGIPSNKKIILYAPTWRDDKFQDDVGYVYTPPFQADYLQEQLSDEYVLLFRAHYLISKTFDFTTYKDFIYDVSDIDDINDLYLVSDVLVTDYSSVFFDYANLRRPMLFYMYDMNHYQNDLRGFYLPLDAVPGDIVITEQQLVKKLQDLEAYTEQTARKVAQFSQEYNYLDDGHATDRVISTVFDEA